MRLSLSSMLLMGTLSVPCAQAEAPADLALVPFAIGLDAPLAVRHAGDGSGRVYVIERGGTIAAFTADGTRLTNVLDISGLVSIEGEGGLLGLAFHPDFPADPRLFVYYTDNNVDTVVASYTTSGDPPVAAPASGEVLLRVDQDFTNHNGGDIHFGSDGMLYVALGDGGSGNDPCNRAQTLDPAALTGADFGGGGTDTGCDADDDFLTGGAFAGNPDSRALLGKMLRIDVDAVTAAGANGLCGGAVDGAAGYAIPVGNPFAGSGTANGCDEVWHYGLRNPYRFSFDRANGEMYIGDVGQNAWEEIDFAAAGRGGLNFGWDVCEGDHATGSSNPCGLAGAIAPILEYANAGDECAVTGGYRYRGLISPLQGDYVYGDFCSGRVWIASRVSGAWNATLWSDTALSIAGFGEDEQGALYVAHIGGEVLRFDSAFVDGIFADGFEAP